MTGQRDENRGRVGPSRVVTTPSTMNRPQAKSVKEAALRSLKLGMVLDRVEVGPGAAEVDMMNLRLSKR